MYADEVTKHRTFKNAGKKVNGRRISSISYENDKILAETPQQLQRMIYRLATESEKYGMPINTTKTKVMQISRTQLIRPLWIFIGRTQHEEVSSY